MLIAAAAILCFLLPQFKRLKRTEGADHGAGALRCTGRGSVGADLLESLVLRSLNRFLHGMEDAGNAGRIRMWTYALETKQGLSLWLWCGQLHESAFRRGRLRLWGR